jgi:dipeptidyl-peptidase-4
MYVYDIATKKTTQITKDGKNNAIINGNCDWVYEEEFSFTQAYQWSEKGNYLAYYKFDESKVPSFTFTMFDSLYPTQYTYKYPKAGDANSIVSIFIYDVKTGKQVKANTGKETDVYIPRIKFTKQDDKLSISWLNRLQNEMQLLLVDAKTGTSKPYYKEKNKYYIETETGDVEFLQDGKHAIISSEQQGYNQLYKISLDGSSKTLLTKNKTDVTSIVGIDEKNNKVYFIDCGRGSTNRDFCSVDLNGNNYKVEMPQLGTHNIKMSSDFSYGFHTYSNITQPTVYSLVNMQTGKKRILKDNAKLSNLLLDYQTVTPQITKIANSKGDSLNTWILYPKNFDATKKYPVLFCNYGGPGSQQVGNRWGAVNMWHQYLAQNGYMIVCVDNTGTGFRGEEFKKKTYLQLGKLEIEDQIDAARYLATLPYIDGNRIGHWGWSYGGFMSSLAITKGADVFKTAIAVAPVTHWKFYDNIYTERYMRTPKENKEGYNNNAPLNEVNKIKGNYLIIHGTADDNVHFQNSVAMIDEMVKKNIKFESAYYPNKNHGIYGGNTTFHIYSLMTKFILEKL